MTGNREEGMAIPHLFEMLRSAAIPFRVEFEPCVNIDTLIVVSFQYLEGSLDAGFETDLWEHMRQHGTFRV